MAVAPATAVTSVTAVAAVPTVEVLGVRHHGPGSARSVVAALELLRPDTILVEGPADADELLRWVADAELEPPVALLAYAVDRPAHAVFWPFAVFSPEWQAIRWGLAHGARVRFCDLPSTAVLAEPEPAPAGGVRTDPIAALAAAAGHDDPERWWDDLVEQRPMSGLPGAGPFPALTAAMAAVREGTPSSPEPPGAALEERREAYMRRVLREVLRGGAGRVAVVCGAWHAPALTEPLPTASRDAALLKGLPRRKAAVTWVPWTHSRLAQASGYGAGITSPGWYHHLFTAADRPVTRWFTRVAAELRRADLPVSSAHVIEAVRTADALAALRGRPLAGLAEVTDATLAVLCDGSEAVLRIVTERLVVGEALGNVPADAPTVPLAADLAGQARRLRLTQEPQERTLDLDLRTAGGSDRSCLLHRLTILGIGWGVPRESEVRSTGTFRECWTLQWRPQLSVAIVEASGWGTTVEAAATARLLDRASGPAASLAEITSSVETALLARLPTALRPLLAALDRRAAGDLDVRHLMDAVPALVRSLRYGDVRRTDTASLARVADTLAIRVEAALPAALGGLGDDAAAELRRRVDLMHGAVELRATLPDGEAARERWLDVLQTVAGRRGVHGLLAGRIVRLLADAGRCGPEEVALRLGRALSAGTPAGAQAAWVEGALGGAGLVLAHDPTLLGVLDAWLAGLPAAAFDDVLPLLRRTFSTFAGGERRLIAERIRRAPGAGTAGAAAPGSTAAADGWDVDEDRARPAVLAATRLLCGGGR
ncbi:MAG TPA: DUF5682 family protein [Kineosporiaceae bacterium]